MHSLALSFIRISAMVSTADVRMCLVFGKLSANNLKYFSAMRTTVQFLFDINSYVQSYRHQLINKGLNILLLPFALVC